MKTLTFKKIDIEAFGAFKHPQEVNLATSVDKPMILVEGMNGCGKTTFLTALQIVLFGDRLFQKSVYESLIEDLARKDVDQVPRIRAEIAFTDSEGEHSYIISRAWHLPPRKFHEYVYIAATDKSENLTIDEWNDLVDQYLPVELADMFFFDGEKIEQMANPSRLPLILKTATQAFLGVKEIDTLFNDTVALERRTVGKNRQERGDVDGDVARLKEIQAEIKLHEDEMERLVLRLGEAQLEYDKAEKAVALFKLEAERKGLSLYKQSVLLKEQFAMVNEALEKARADLIAAVANEYLPLARLTTLMTKMLERQKIESNAAHAKETLAFVKAHDQRLLERVQKAYPQALSLIREFLKDEKKLIEENQSEEKLLKPMLPANLLRERIEKAVDARDVAKERVEQLEEKLRLVQANIDAIPSDDQISIILEEENTVEKELARTQAKQKFIKDEQERISGQLAKLRSQESSLEDLLRNSYKGTAKTQAMLAAGKRVRSVLKIYKDRLLAHKAQWLSSAITQHYLRLMRKQSLVHAVEVDPVTYDVSVKMLNGETLPMLRLSAGERQLLATAVLSALIGQRSCSFPVVVDTPLARLDRSHRMNMVKNFYATVSHQVMVLSTDEEITGVLKDEAMQHVRHGYRLVYDENEQATNIKEMQ